MIRTTTHGPDEIDNWTIDFPSEPMRGDEFRIRGVLYVIIKRQWTDTAGGVSLHITLERA
jgi:hypothetical protein